VKSDRLRLLLLGAFFVVLLTAFIFVYPAFAQGTIGEPHYTVKGQVALQGTIIGNPSMDITYVDVIPTGGLCMMSFSQPLCLAGFCSGDEMRVSIGGKTQNLGSWAVTPVGSRTVKDFSISCLTEGEYTLRASAYGWEREIVAEDQLTVIIP